MRLLYTVMITFSALILEACNQTSKPKPRAGTGATDDSRKVVGDNSVSPEDLLVLQKWQPGQTLGNRFWQLVTVVVPKSS